MIYYYDNREFDDENVFRVYLINKYLTKHYGNEKARQLIIANKDDLLFIAKLLGKEDIGFFAEYFLTSNFVCTSENELKPLGNVHYEIFDNLDELLIKDSYDNQEFILPRGIGKSTIINSLTATWGAVYKTYRFTVVLGKTDKLMAEFIDEVRNNLSNEYLVQYFGTFISDKKDLVNNSCELELLNGCKVQGSTWGGSIRGIKYKGRRPDLIITDDILKEDDIKSDNMKQNSIGKFYKEVLPAGSEARVINGKKDGMSTKFIVIGTPLAQDDFINYVRNDSQFKILHKQVCEFDVDDYFSNSDKWQEYRKLLMNSYNKDRINTAKEYYLANENEMKFNTIWSNYPILKMANKYFTERLSFMQEYQCDCSKVGEQWVKYMAKLSIDEIEKHKFNKTILAIDSAASSNSKSDFYAFTVLSESNGFLFVREGILKKFDSKTQFDEYIDFSANLLRKWTDINAVCIEKNVYKGLDMTAIEKKIEEDETLKKRNIQSILIFNTKNKDDRIATIADKINSGTVIFNENDNDYNKQVFEFCGQRYSLHDDAIDSLEMAVNNIDKIETGKVKLFSLEQLFKGRYK